jgi:hypothetical protein
VFNPERPGQLGAAVDAIGHSPNALRQYEEWKWTKRIINCPACTGKAHVAAVIAHLNDRHQWTRQTIAEWVSTIEPTEETSSEGEEFSSVV